MNKKGNEVINFTAKQIGLHPNRINELAGLGHTALLEIHSRAMAAHCECLGMNAENMWAAIADQPPIYLSRHYSEMMEKWGLVDKEGKPII